MVKGGLASSYPRNATVTKKLVYGSYISCRICGDEYWLKLELAEGLSGIFDLALIVKFIADMKAALDKGSSQNIGTGTAAPVKPAATARDAPSLSPVIASTPDAKSAIA